jgi:hypothetical protein
MSESETKEKKPRVRRSKIDVRVISRAGQAALVEWLDKGEFFRATIPQKEISDGKVYKDVLAAGVPYGLDWSTVKIKSIKPSELNRELKRLGVWTLRDVAANPTAFHAAVNRLAGLVRKDFVASVKEQQEE